MESLNKHKKNLEIIQVDNQIFKKIIENVVDVSEDHKTNLSVKNSYAGHDCFLFDDGRGGFCVDQKSNELCNVFTIENGVGRGSELLSFATAEHNKLNLDCFDDPKSTPNLPKLYAKYGFKEQKREKNFNLGGPDVVFMSYENQNQIKESKKFRDILQKNQMNKYLQFY